MRVLEVIQPGVWLEGIEDDEARRNIESLLRLLTTCIDDAAIALNLFEECLLGSFSIDPSASWEADRERERAIAIRLEAAIPAGLDGHARFEAMDAAREQARIEAKREKWREGVPPSGYVHRLPFLHAKSFVYALDTLQKSLRLITEIDGVPLDVSAALSDFEAAFSDLLHVRDSSHHVEDRVQGKRRQKKIDLQPLMNSAIHAPGGGVLVVDMLNGQRYGGTLGDGTYGEVDISAESAVIARDCVQRVLNAFSWHGPATHSPS
ncbi:MAG: hypothetical protein JWP56_2992 [Aeromicrobium sp.]|nr:hypothetical protein [Aeromicrobium sp.]